MAHKKMVLTERGAQVYRTRMLSAGDPVTLGASDARLFAKHGWAEEPKRKVKAAPQPEPQAHPEPTAEIKWTPAPLVIEEVAAPAKAPPKRRGKARK